MIKKIFTGLFILLLLFNTSAVAYAQESPEQKKARLEAELLQYEKEIKAKEALLEKQKGQTGSIKRDISILTTEIDKAKIKIKERALVITKLGDEIKSKNNKIQDLSLKLENQRESLAELIRKTNENDDSTFVTLVLSNQTLSGLYTELDSISSVKESLKLTVDELRGIRTETEKEKESLENKQNEETDVKVELEGQKKKVEISEKEKQRLLNASKQQETTYSKLIAADRAKANAIRAELFNLAGGGGGIEFGAALEYALQAEKATGIRPAFLLAILTQESNLGQNTGQCFLTDYTTGAGVGAKTGTAISRVMKPDRDVTPFLAITASLGRDPKTTRVSCPQSIGYGGAMGPAQFIPSTWMLMKPKVAAAIGGGTPDPWLPRDAFIASSVYLSNLGASAKTYTAERNAACRYYSGRVCTALVQAANYGNSVMGKAAAIQLKIDNLKTLDH